MKISEFLDKDIPLQKELINYSVVVKEDELENSKGYKLKHKEVWDKYGVKTEFRSELKELL